MSSAAPKKRAAKREAGKAAAKKKRPAPDDAITPDDLPPAAREVLERRAADAGSTVRDEMLASIGREAAPDQQEFLRRARALRERFRGRTLSDSTELIREDRDR